MKSETPDLVCLQEVRARPDQIETENLRRLEELYPNIIWNPADRPGYSGVAVFAKQKAVEMKLGIGNPKFDVEGRVIWLRFNEFNLFNIYFPNGGHDQARVPFKLDFYADLLEVCKKLHANEEKIILCGDFNTAHQPIDLKNPKENETVSGFLPEERAWIDKYLDHGFLDIYRTLFPDLVKYTWWTYRLNARQRGIGWRLDYFLVSANLTESISDVIIHDQVYGSDHCPVELQINEKP